MTATRRILDAGLPAAGLTVFAALAFTGSSAAAVEDHALLRPTVTATPCDSEDRGGCGYGSVSPTGTATPTDTVTGAGETPGTGPTRGHTGYPSTDTVPPTTPPGVRDTVTPSPGGVSPAHELPVTGAPAGAIISLGAVLVAGGAASVYYTLRRRNA